MTDTPSNSCLVLDQDNNRSRSHSVNHPRGVGFARNRRVIKVNLVLGFQNVLRARPESVNDTAPAPFLLNLKRQRFPKHVHHDVNVLVVDGGTSQVVRERVRVERGVDSRSDSVPADVVAPVDRPHDRAVCFAEGNHHFEETVNVGMLLEQVPVEPSRVVV